MFTSVSAWTPIFLFLFNEYSYFPKFFQYLLLTPTYVNILNVYAFCNTHDITWGTKGEDKPEKLPTANLKPGGKVDVDIPTDDTDLNKQYENEMKLISAKAIKEVKKPSASEKQEDYYKGFRSAVVLAWILSNFALAAVVLNAAGFDRISIAHGDTSREDQLILQKSTIYMAVVLWSVAGLSAFRFLGAVWFLIVRLVCIESSITFCGFAVTTADEFYL